MVELDRKAMYKSRKTGLQAAREWLTALEDRLDELEWMCQRTADEVALLSAAAADAAAKGGSRTCNK